MHLPCLAVLRKVRKGRLFFCRGPPARHRADRVEVCSHTVKTTVQMPVVMHCAANFNMDRESYTFAQNASSQTQAAFVVRTEKPTKDMLQSLKQS